MVEESDEAVGPGVGCESVPDLMGAHEHEFESRSGSIVVAVVVGLGLESDDEEFRERGAGVDDSGGVLAMGPEVGCVDFVVCVGTFNEGRYRVFREIDVII